MNDLGFEQAVDRLGERIIVGIADAADRWLDPRLGQTFGVSNGDVLTATIAMMYQLMPPQRAALVERLLQGVKYYKGGLGRPRYPPSDNAAGKDVDDESDIDKPLPGGDIGEIETQRALGPEAWN